MKKKTKKQIGGLSGPRMRVINRPPVSIGKGVGPADGGSRHRRRLGSGR
jgi:hypothetical protein